MVDTAEEGREWQSNNWLSSYCSAYWHALYNNVIVYFHTVLLYL